MPAEWGRVNYEQLNGSIDGILVFSQHPNNSRDDVQRWQVHGYLPSPVTLEQVKAASEFAENFQQRHPDYRTRVIVFNRSEVPGTIPFNSLEELMMRDELTTGV